MDRSDVTGKCRRRLAILGLHEELMSYHHRRAWGVGRTGSIYKFTDKELLRKLFMMSLHDLNLVDTLRLGRQIQPELMPNNITIIGIEGRTGRRDLHGLRPRSSAIDPVHATGF